MSIEILATRIAVDFGWDTTEITGEDASLLLNGVELCVVPNDGEVKTVFPIDFNGPVEVTIRGSESGEQTDILEVVSPLFDAAPAEGTDNTDEVEVTTPPSEVPDDGEPLPDVPVDPTSEPLPADVPAPTEPEGSDLPVVPEDSESEIPDDASSEIGSGEVSPVVPDDTQESPVDPALPVNEPAEDVGTTPAEGGETGTTTVS